MKKETVFKHLCISGLKKTQLLWINAAVMQSQQREAVRRHNWEDQRHLWKISNIQSMKKATNALPSLKFCTKIFLQRLFQLLPAAQARSPPQRPGATVCSWWTPQRLPIISEKRRIDSPSPLCATLKEASHAQTRTSTCCALTDLHANV